jgi:ferrous iron transport protein B
VNAAAEPAAPDAAEERSRLVALIGNPNTGKTTLFNRVTGSTARVGNYPGITVDRRVGQAKLVSGPHDGEMIDLLDLPGTYSLSARSPEEQIAIEATLGIAGQPAPDLAVVVVDAGQLVRNLYLVVQLLELAVPMVVAVNMIDEVKPRPDLEALRELFGVPFVATNARLGEGIDRLLGAVSEGLEEPPVGHVSIPYPDDLLADLPDIVEALPDSWREVSSPAPESSAEPAAVGRSEALALWALSCLGDDDELAHIPPTLRDAVTRSLDAAGERDVDGEIITSRYALLDGEVTPLLGSTETPPSVAWTDRVDRVVLHPVWGFAIFIALMLVVFQALFSWASPCIEIVEAVVSWIGGLTRQYLPEGFVADLVTEGVVGGVGNVVVFLPQILLLFLLLGLLEDSGYMARAAYLMDRIMKALGLHGRAFVPMLSGCACAIPAIMATRTMERERDRLLTMLVIPLMTCSARLPVYTLIIAALFPPMHLWGLLPVQGLLMVFMYFFSTFMALAAAGVIGRTVVKGRRMPLLLELPPYRVPTARSVLRQTWERARSFLKEAGTVILAFTIILWALLSYPKPDTAEPLATKAVATIQHALPGATASEAERDVASLSDNAPAVAAWQRAKLERSLGGQMGKLIEPAIAPLGFDWKIGVGLIGAFAAREVFVSTMGLVYGIGSDVDEESAPLRERIRSESWADGKPVYTPLMGMSLMVFFALACQCMSTIAVVKRETKSWRWPAFLFVYMTSLAWVMSFLVYQGGKLLGFS